MTRWRRDHRPVNREKVLESYKHDVTAFSRKLDGGGRRWRRRMAEGRGKVVKAGRGVGNGWGEGWLLG